MPLRTEEVIASVAGLWRYPVKSMMGQELGTADLNERGLIGDRQYALVDSETGKVASAKNPRKWPTLFACRATFLERPSAATDAPRISITLPDGTAVTSDQSDLADQLAKAFGRGVRLTATPLPTPSLEEYWPQVEGLPHADTVTDEAMPPNSFFDCAPVHLITSAALNRLTTMYPSSRFEPRRFRPNIFLMLASQDPGLDENEWVGRTLCIGDVVQLRITGPCARCVMTTLPQGDLPQDSEILRSVVKENKGCVGIYATVTRGGTIRRRDPVRLQ